MAIEFVLEDGTGLSNSTSYVSVADFKQYWENRTVDYSTKTDAQVQGKLNEATQYIDNLNRYKGTVEQTTQALQFPRDGIINNKGVDVSGTVPIEVVYATCEIAAYSFTYSLDPAEQNSIRSRTMGSLSVSFGNSGETGAVIIRADKYLGVYTDNQLRVCR